MSILQNFLECSEMVSAEISVKEGEATQSVADPGEDCRAFP